MKLPRFRIKTLLLVTLLLAVVTALARPFTPNIQFEAIATSPLLDPTEPHMGSQHNLLIINNSRQPIWLAGRSPSNLIYIAAYGFSDLPTGDLMSPAELTKSNFEDGVEIYWIRLNQGQSFMTEHGPTLAPYTIGLHVSDWRGRKADVWAPLYEPPYLETQDSTEAPIAADTQ